MKSSMMKMNLDVLSTDLQGTCLNDPMLEKFYTTAGLAVMYHRFVPQLV
jgi:hypothetical protein